MSLRIRHPWLLAFAGAVGLLAVAVLSGKSVIEPLSFGLWLAVLFVGCLVGLGFCWVVFLLTPWRNRSRARQAFRHFVWLVVLIVVLAVSYHTWLTTDADRVRAVKSYVQLAEPRIEQYFRDHHRYPESLAKLNLGIAEPWGLDYHVIESDVVGADEFAVESDHEGERYVIFFGDLWYHGDGNWDVGHL